jgi:ketosteroid isomerase-like protein
MTSPNMQTILSFYAAIARGDGAGAFAHLSPDIVWIEAENFPYADGNPYVGLDAVAEGVFARLLGEWDGFAAVPEVFHDAGDAVIVRGRYQGSYKGTGKSISARFVHVWTLAGGKAVAFEQYTDTLQVAEAMRE